MWCGAFSTWGLNAALAGDGGGRSGFDMSSNSSSDATRWRNHRLYVRVKHAKVCELHQRSSKYALLAKQDSDGAGEGGGKWMSDAVESVFLAQRREWVNGNAKPVQPWETFWCLLKHDVFCGNGNEDCIWLQRNGAAIIRLSWAWSCAAIP